MSVSNNTPPMQLVQRVPPRQPSGPNLREEDLPTAPNRPDSIHNPSTQKLTDVLFDRYGFVLDGVSSSSMDFSDEIPWAVVRNLIVDHHSVVAPAHHGLITHFIAVLMQYTPERSLGSYGQLWDLSEFCSSRLRDHLNHHIRVEIKRSASGTFYFIEPVGLHYSMDVPWRLAVPDAATAVQCLRSECGPSRLNVAMLLVRKGIPFNTFLPNSSSVPRPRHLNPWGGLGTRTANYRPDTADYAAYIAARKVFFQQPHARAALLKGGIVWRLAIESLDYDVALSGPSDGLVQIVSVGRESFSDDDLSERELELICGVYKVSISTSVQSSQTADMSWWPKLSVWAKCGLNVGYWSPDCEYWYQERLRRIQTNGASLRSAAGWKSALKMRKETPTMVAHNENAASQFLSGKELM